MESTNGNNVKISIWEELSSTSSEGKDSRSIQGRIVIIIKHKFSPKSMCEWSHILIVKVL